MVSYFFMVNSLYMMLHKEAKYYLSYVRVQLSIFQQ